MDRINGAGHVNRRFVTENVAVGRPPTEITYDWLNGVQEELCAVIAAAGLVLDAGDSSQLLKSIIKLIPPAAEVLPAGEVVFFARHAAPTGYLKANGAAVSRIAYSALFAAIGTTFGVGDGATTFTLPDLRGEFMRGLDDGRGVDPGRSIGSAQAQGLQSHDHSVPWRTAGVGYASGGYGPPAEIGSSTACTLTGGNETRPRNIALLACIRY